MNIYKLQIGFFIVLTLCIAVLVYFILAPYLAAVFLAIITAVITAPVNLFYRRQVGNKVVASILSLVTVFIIIFLPLLYIGNSLIQESTDLYVKSTTGEPQEVFHAAVDAIEFRINSILPTQDLDLERYSDLGLYIRGVTVWITQNVSNFFSGVLKITLSAFLFILCLFYLYKDGEKLLPRIIRLSPLFDTYDTVIISKLERAVNSVIRGQLLVGLIQGILTGLGFYIFGVPSAFIWGVVAAVASLVPTIGTAIVTIPGILFLFFTGNTFGAIGLLIWAIVAVGLVDNIIGPILMKKGVHIHPFLILLSVLGGLSLFGPVGFIAGPVTCSLLFALLDIYPTIIKERELKA